MRKFIVVLPVLGALALAGFFIFRPAASTAQFVPKDIAGAVDAAPKDEREPAVKLATVKPAAAELPMARVVLYSSGVGYFERAGKVDGQAQLELSFPVQDINDLLKSLVLQDLGGGHVSAVGYDSHEPIAKTLGNLAVNFAANPSFAQILSQTQGEKVEVALKSGKSVIAGTVISVDLSQPLPMNMPVPPGYGYPGPMPTNHQSPYGARWSASYAPTRPTDGVISVLLEGKEKPGDSDVVNLWCTDGMRSLPVKDIERIRYLNPKMEDEVRRALDVLATAHDTKKKTVTLQFDGQGRRSVKVGYVVENPLWRTSYRLLVGKDGKLFLQAWALVENPSNEDWKDVRMSLVSGRPISFRMDLYQPLYMTRPVVEPDLCANVVRPQTHAGVMEWMSPGIVKGLPMPPAPRQAPVPMVMPQSMPPPVGSAAMTPPGPPQVPGGEVLGQQQPMAPPQNAQQQNAQQQNINLQNGVVAAATTGDLGSFFEYAIEHPVTVARQKSAMLPIANKPIAGSKVSVFNRNTHAKYPLLALHLKNTTGLHLMQGPITVLEGSSYAGDALLADIQPNEERLVSYAIDTGVEVEPLTSQAPESYVSIKMSKGVVLALVKQRQVTTYNVKNRTGHDRLLLVEHPICGTHKLVSKEKPKERTREMYRFELKVPTEKSAQLEVIEELDHPQSLALRTFDASTLRFYMQAKFANTEVKDVLAAALKMHEGWAQTQNNLARQREHLQTITQDQERLRANLKEMPATSVAYKRYLQKFDTQETEIETLQERIRALQIEEQRSRQEYEGFLNRIELESAIVTWPVDARPTIVSVGPQ